MADALKSAKTGALICSWICMGLFSEVSSPTLPYLKDRIRCNYEQISRALVARAAGFFVGSLVAGVVGSKWRRLNNFWMFLALFVAGTATIVAPLCPNLSLLAAMFFLDGTGKGVIAVVASTGIMNLWREKAAVPTHALHFSFGVGALIAPQVALPFIPDSSNGILPDTNATISIRPLMDTNSTVPLYANSTSPDSTLDKTDRIEIAYAIIGSVTILCSLFFLFFQITSWKSADDTDAVKRKPERSSSGACTRLAAMCKGIKSSTAILLVIIFVFLCLPTGAERSYSKFLFAYAVDGPLSIAPSTGALLETVFWASFTAGRGVSTIASKWVPPHVLLAVEIVIKVICSFVLAFVANSNKIVLFVASGIFGATVSPIFPSVVVWTNLYVEMNAMMNSFTFLAGAIGAMFFSWCAGYLFTYMGPPFLMYLMVAYALATLVVYIITYSFLRFGNFPKREKHVPPPTVEEIEHLTGDLTVSKPL